MEENNFDSMENVAFVNVRKKFYYVYNIFVLTLIYLIYSGYC